MSLVDNLIETLYKTGPDFNPVAANPEIYHPAHAGEGFTLIAHATADAMNLLREDELGLQYIVAALAAVATVVEVVDKAERGK